MTILKFRKTNKGHFWGALALAFLLGAFMIVREYGELADSRHSLRVLNKRIEEATLKGDELKSVFYKITDPAILSEIARVNHLIIEEKPEYLEISEKQSDIRGEAEDL